MMQQGLKHCTESPMVVFGMMLLYAIYIGAIVWTFWVKGNQERLDRISSLPLQDEETSL